MNLLKPKVFIATVITFISTATVLGVLGYILIPRVGNNDLLPISVLKMQEYGVSATNGIQPVNEMIIKELLAKSHKDNRDYREKYQALVDMYNGSVVKTNFFKKIMNQIMPIIPYF